jgi:hypothetical protein
LNFFLAYDLANYLGDFKGAGQAMEAAAACPGSPGYLRELSARYYVHGNDLKRAEELTTAMLEAATDDNTRSVMSRHLEELKAEPDLQLFEGAMQTYRMSHDGHAPASVDDPDFLAALGGRPFSSFRDPAGDNYVYDSNKETFRSATLARFTPHPFKK